ncbi:MAG TPA: hypothetical protein VI365_30500 [Trebonia sp.]
MTEQIHRLTLTPELRTESPYLAVPFEVPPGTESIEVELCFVHRSTRIDLGLRRGRGVARLVRERTTELRHRAGCCIGSRTPPAPPSP